MTVQVYDISKSAKAPQFETFMLKGHSPDGLYTIHAGPIKIVMDAGEKENLIAEWALMERLFSEWKAQGKTCDFSDPAFEQFLTDGHRR